jgi:hypothetical protein
MAQSQAASSLNTSKTPTVDEMTDDENDDWMDNFPPTFIPDGYVMNSDELKRRMTPLCYSANLLVRQAIAEDNEKNKPKYDPPVNSEVWADAVKGLKEMVREGDAQMVEYQCKGNDAACPCE